MQGTRAARPAYKMKKRPAAQARFSGRDGGGEPGLSPNLVKFNVTGYDGTCTICHFCAYFALDDLSRTENECFPPGWDRSAFFRSRNRELKFSKWAEPNLY